MTTSKIAIVGAGAAGLMACCRLADAGYTVTLFEKNDRPGKKLAITGKGRCNLTNAADRQDFFDSIPRNAKFLYSAYGCFSNFDTMRYFEEDLALPLKTERGNRVFPVSDRALDVVNALRAHVEGKVKVVRARVSALYAEDGAVKGLRAGGKDYSFDRVLIATGGCSYPATGSTGDGYRLAESLGHTVIPPRPSLVPLETEGSVCRALQGLSLKNTALTVIDKTNGKTVYTDFGELLFTHFGLSGPTVLSASAHIRDMARGRYEISLDLKPALDLQTLDKRLLSDFEKYKNRDFANALGDLLPAKMIPVIVSLSGVEAHKKVNAVTKAERLGLAGLLKDLRFTVRGFRPIEEAIVTSGGISVREIDPSSMESRLVKGLYFAGEVIDVDAYTGGFNLQIAFSTAALAARSIIMTS